MLSNICIFRIAKDTSLDLEQARQGVKSMAFQPCAATQDQSVGWVAPRGIGDELIESVAGQWILRLQLESKMLPSAVVKRTADAKAKQIEDAGGRKLGRAAIKDLREQVHLELLPRAFTKLSCATVWIDPTAKLVCIEAASPAKADVIAVLLLASIDGLAMSPMQTQKAAAVCMASWLMDQDAPGRFSLDRECELKATDETQAIARYMRHNIEIDEVKTHVVNGKMPTKLALTWADRTAFLLTDKLQIKKIKLLDGVMETQATENEDAFDGDVAILTGELSKLIPDLIEALGGEEKQLF
ncbi:MAG: recombination-associated protein RdgC [Casimicrobium sp.]